MMEWNRLRADLAAARGQVAALTADECERAGGQLNAARAQQLRAIAEAFGIKADLLRTGPRLGDPWAS